MAAFTDTDLCEVAADVSRCKARWPARPSPAARSSRRPAHDRPRGRARRHRRQPDRRQVAARDQRASSCSCSPSRRCSRSPGCWPPARGRDRAADRARRDPVAAHPADRGRGDPAVAASPRWRAASPGSGWPGCSAARSTAGRRGAGAGGISLAAAGTWLDALAAALGVAVLAVGALLYPVLRPARRGRARVRRGRQAVLSSATRAGADLALIALAVLAGWQLRRYSAVSHVRGGPPAIDPVLVARPRARARRRHGAHAAAAARRGPGRRPAGRGRPRAHRARSPAGSSAASRCARAAPPCCSSWRSPPARWRSRSTRAGPGPPPTRRRTRPAPTCG